jgi:hypothetical protein
MQTSTTVASDTAYWRCDRLQSAQFPAQRSYHLVQFLNIVIERMP